MYDECSKSASYCLSIFLNREYNWNTKLSLTSKNGVTFIITVWREIFAGQNFRGFLRICLRPRKFYPQRKPHPFPSKPFESLASVCVMAIYCYFSSVDKLPKLPDPTGSLSTKVPSSSIVLANARAEESVGEGKGAMSSCCPMSMMVYNIGLSLTWLLLTNGCIPDIFIKSGIHAPSLKR